MVNDTHTRRRRSRLVGLEEGECGKKLSLCYSVVYYYNGAQRYEQFLQVGRLYQALILLGLALSSDRLCVFGLHDALSLLCALPFQAGPGLQ